MDLNASMPALTLLTTVGLRLVGAAVFWLSLNLARTIIQSSRASGLWRQDTLSPQLALSPLEVWFVRRTLHYAPSQGA